MRFVSSITPLTLATLGTICIFNACAPNNGDRIRITQASPNSFQKAIATCTDSLSPAEKHSISKGKIELCEYRVDPTTGSVSSTLERVQNGVSYSVEPSSDKQGRRTNRVNFKHVIELQSLTKTDAKELKALETAVTKDCKSDIQQIFSRSHAGVQMSLDLTIEVADADLSVDDVSTVAGASDTTPDQVLYVVKGTDAGDPAWALTQLERRPRYYPLARATDKQDCITKGGTAKDQLDCVSIRRHTLSRPFCAALAKRVGNMMGLVDTAHEAQLCGAQAVIDGTATAPSATPVPKPVTTAPKSVNALLPHPGGAVDATATADKEPPMTNDGDSSFAKPTASDDEYLSKSTLNRKDIVTILGPACPNLKK